MYVIWVGQPVSVTFFAVTATFGRAALADVVRVWTIMVRSGTVAERRPARGDRGRGGPAGARIDARPAPFIPSGSAARQLPANIS